jgi:hypothetical protein
MPNPFHWEEGMEGFGPGTSGDISNEVSMGTFLTRYDTCWNKQEFPQILVANVAK